MLSLLVLLTVPAPLPDLVTVKVGLADVASNWAVTVLLSSIVTVHVSPVPAQKPPVQPVKLDEEDTTAVKRTDVPGA